MLEVEVRREKIELKREHRREKGRG